MAEDHGRADGTECRAGADPTDADVTVTADDGSFDADVPAGSLTSFRAPERPGSHPFTSRHAPDFTGVLVVG